MLKYLVILLLSVSQSYAGDKYAILIGIGAYPKEVGVTKLNGDNDLSLMQITLTGLGFSKNNIFLLKNSDATKEKIIKTFENVYSLVKKGDIVVVHFSGHGKQVVDDEIDIARGFKEEADGYDEAILCYDGSFLIDDEIHLIFQQIQSKIEGPGQLVAFFDCCYSGTITRDIKDFKNQNSFEEFSSNKNNQGNLFFFSSVSASGKSEQSVDGAGVLTEALSKLLKFSTKTYGELFSKLQEEISKRPNASTNFLLLPTFEGNSNSLVFGQSDIFQEFFFEIQKISSDSSSVIINGGKLAGVFQNSEIGIYPIGTKSATETKPIYIGTVEIAENFNSKVVFSKKVRLPNLKSYWVFVTKPEFDDYHLNIAVDKKDSVGLATLFQKYSLLKLTTIIKNAPYSLINDKKEIILLDNFELNTIKSSENIENVLTTAQQLARASILRKIESQPDKEYQISIELVPISKNNIDLRDSLSHILYMKGNRPTFDTTMRSLLKITNIGEKPCFFSVINISSNGQIQPVLPSDESTKYDLFLPKKGFTFLSDEILGFTPPFGDEVLIGFASKKPINLFPILNNSWTQGRGEESPLNALLNDVYSGTRSPQDIDLKKSEGSIFKYYYRITPKF